MNNIPWIEKYRPKKLSDITQSSNLIELFENSIKTTDLTHYLFYGPPGTGKTSAILAIGREIFKEYFKDRVIEFNASDDRGINAVREKISNEAKKYVSNEISKDGTVIPSYKIIILDEADSMTDEAQDALRVIIEQYSKVTRFCFICNYISKITDAIKSRCTPIYFKKLSNECMINKLNEIAMNEKLPLFNNELYDTIIYISNGDMRKAIMLLQNLKYLHNYKITLNKPIKDLTINQLKTIQISNKKINKDITKNDIYKLAAFISMEEADEIIKEILICNNIKEVSKLVKKIIATGNPIDNILTQLNKAILETEIFNDEKKAIIINYSGEILYKMKESSNEYIQLLNYMINIFNIL